MQNKLSEIFNDIVMRHYNEIQAEVKKAIESNELMVEDKSSGLNDLASWSRRFEDCVEVEINGRKTSYTIALELLFHDQTRIHRSLEEALLKDDGMSQPTGY